MQESEKKAKQKKAYPKGYSPVCYEDSSGLREEFKEENIDTPGDGSTG